MTDHDSREPGEHHPDHPWAGICLAPGCSFGRDVLTPEERRRLASEWADHDSREPGGREAPEPHLHFGLPRGQCPDRCGGVAGHSGYHQSSDHAAIRAEAAASVRAEIAERVAPMIAEWNTAEKVAAERKDWPMADRWRYLASGADAALAASPDPGTPLPLDVAWKAAEAALIAAQGDDDGFGVEIAYWSEFPDAPWSVAANDVQVEASRLPEALQALTVRLQGKPGS